MSTYSDRLAIAQWLFVPLWAAVMLAVSTSGAGAQTGWLSKIVSEAGGAGGKARRAGASLDDAAAHIARLPAKARAGALAVDITQEGHWRFVNAKGEKFTAGTPAELKRAVGLILPERAQGAALALYLTQDSLFLRRAWLKDLPEAAELHIVTRKGIFPLLQSGDGPRARLLAIARPRVVIALTDRAAFSEAIWQLQRPLRSAGIRILALEPGGPQDLPLLPRIDKASGRALTDSVDPYAMVRSMSSLRGQTALTVGRIKGDFLYFKPAGGDEGAVRLSALRGAARDADVNLIVMNAGSSRQPGSRNWLWLRAEVKGLGDALKRATLADFLGALAGSSAPLEVTVKLRGSGRVQLTARAMTSDALLPTSEAISDMFSDALASLQGDLVSDRIEASLRSKDRQAELDRRILPGIASRYQFAYLALALLGVMAWPVGRSWWRRIWPSEQRSEYRSRSGYIAAQSVRGIIFALVFMPLSAPLALPLHLARTLWRWLGRSGAAGR